MASGAPVVLPSIIVSPGDIQKLRRELETVDDFLHQAAIRQGGKVTKLPRTSHLLEELATTINVTLLHQDGRRRLLKYLTMLSEQAPVLHISFASDPSMAFLSKLTAWLRSNIHPEVLVTVGLQPSIAAGCIVRTNSRQLDFSLRHAFDEQKTLLIKNLKHDVQAPQEAAS